MRVGSDSEGISRASSEFGPLVLNSLSSFTGRENLCLGPDYGVASDASQEGIVLFDHSSFEE